MLKTSVPVVTCHDTINVKAIIENAKAILEADPGIQTVEINANWNGREGSHPAMCASDVVYHRSPEPGQTMGMDTCIVTQDLVHSPALAALFRLERGISAAGWFHEVVKGRSLLVIIIDRQGVVIREQCPGWSYHLLHLHGEPPPEATTESELEKRFPSSDEGRWV